MWLIVGEVYWNFEKIFWNNYIKIDSLKQIKWFSTEEFNSIIWIVSRGAHFRYDKYFLEKLPKLKYLCLFQIWLDNVDLVYCKKRWIIVKNFVSEKSIDAVAQLTIASLILWLRYGFSLGCNLKNWIYKRQPLGYSLENLKIWIVGFWRIWKKVYEYLKLFSVDIGVYDIMIEKIKKNFKSNSIKWFDSLDKIFKRADVITLHIPWGKENNNLIWYDLLKNIKWLINMSRACIVNEEDIEKVLKENDKFFYISDVICGEPNVWDINKELVLENNVFVYPHIGANTIQVQNDIFNKFVNWFKKENIEI